jgi:hypothetical protein
MTSWPSLRTGLGSYCSPPSTGRASAGIQRARELDAAVAAVEVVAIGLKLEHVLGRSLCSVSSPCFIALRSIKLSEVGERYAAACRRFPQNRADPH